MRIRVHLNLLTVLLTGASFWVMKDRDEQY
jgi:hypothetical protein